MWPLQFLRALKIIVLLSCLLSALSLWTPPGLASANPVPHIDRLSPISTAPNGVGFTLTVNGEDFVSGAVVSWNGSPLATVFVSANQLTATVTNSLVASSGTGWVTVGNPGGATSNLAFLPVSTSSAHVNFATFTLTAASGALGVAQGDFNSDGNLDLVTANWSADTLSIFLSNGDGTFQTPQTISLAGVSLRPIGVSVGDFNGDGILDLVVGYESSSGVSILLGNGSMGVGNGTFGAPQTFAAGSNTYESVVGDFNGDGNLDVAVTNYSGSAVHVLLGNGDGTFATAVSYAVNSGAFFIREADLNGDGQLDLVVGDYGGGAISILLGVGDGTFQPQTNYTAGTAAADVAIGDFNSDGIPDLITTSLNGNNMYLLLGNGDGTFQTAQAFPVGFSTEVVAAADFNADGNLDLAVIKSGGGVGVLLGNGDGTFQASQSFPGASFTYGIILGNYNTGGGIGIATTDFTGGTLDVLLQTLSISPGSLNFGNQAISAASAVQTFTITNSTSQLVNISGISFTGTNSADFGETDNCASSLASGASCAVQVTFTPGGAGSRSAALSVGDNAPASPQTAAVTGTGIAAPGVSLSATGIAFPNENVGVTSASQAITVTNTGTLTLNIASIALAGANSADFSASNNCGATLAPSAVCTVTGTFTPSAAGARSAAITLTDDAADSPESISLSGQGVLAPTATLSASSLTFSQQAVGSTSSAQTVTLTNNGNSTLGIATIAASGANAADFGVTNNCGPSVAAGGNCSINATFTPVTGGARAASITVTDNASDSPQSVSLSGQGLLLAPTATLSASSLTFSQQVVGSTSATQAVTLTNNGNTALAITSIAAAGANAADFGVANTCGTSLAAGTHCSISATFTPAASGSRSASVTITDTAPGSSQSIALSGTGQDFSLSLTSSTATVTAGNSANLQLTITPVAGFNQVVTLACSGAPSLTTCTVTPSTITPSGSAVTVAVTLTTTGQMIATRRYTPPGASIGIDGLRMLCLVAFCIFASGFTARRFNIVLEIQRHGSRGLIFGGVLLLVALGFTACAGTVSAPVAPKTPAGAYTVTITATSGALTRSTTVNLTVQ